MLVPYGPETDQWARHALSLRHHIAHRSPTLDDLAAVVVDATGAVMAFISIADCTTQHVVGACNCNLESFQRTYARHERVGDFVEITRMDENPLLATHPVTNQPQGPIRSVLITGLYHQGICVGSITVASDLPEAAFGPEHRMVILRLARVAEAVIRSEVTISKVAADALAVLSHEG